MQDSKSPGFNLTFPVGSPAVNHPNDVLLVQAMFNFIADGFEDGSMLGIKSAKELPKINGVMDGLTKSMINKFQERWVHALLRSDGKIHPAMYGGRNIQASARGPIMTITMLHLICGNAAALFNEVDYTNFMPRRFPALWTFVDRITWQPTNAELGISSSSP